MLTTALRTNVRAAQANEMTEHLIYHKLAMASKDLRHKEILEKISAEELRHHDIFQDFTRETVRPGRIKILFFVFLGRVFGLNFALRLLEGGEDSAQTTYEQWRQVPQIDAIIREEKEHEMRLLDMIDEERLRYAGSVVLGLNDALVELTGALVGFSLALQNTRLVAIVGLITGLAASMSMASAEYLSTKQEDAGRDPLKASVYTGLAYVTTVAFLVLPYFIFSNLALCLVWVVLGALFVIFIFTFYISVAKNLNFKKRFLEMAGLSLTIAVINFGIGLLIRKVFNIEA